MTRNRPTIKLSTILDKNPKIAVVCSQKFRLHPKNIGPTSVLASGTITIRVLKESFGP